MSRKIIMPEDIAQRVPAWVNIASMINDDKAKDAVITFAACLAAVKEEFHTLGESSVKAGIEAASYIAWRSIMGEAVKPGRRKNIEDEEDIPTFRI